MAQSTAELSYKNRLTANELAQLMGAVYRVAAERGVQMQCPLERAVAHFLFCCRKETQGFNNWAGNPAGFAGLIQCGVDILIESNSKSRNPTWHKRHPVTWCIYASSGVGDPGLHDMYTVKNRKIAVAYHKSLVKAPRSVARTATDAQVSTCVYLDTINFAYSIFNKYFKRNPNNREVYAFNVLGWPLCAAYAALYNGQKNAYSVGKYSKLESVAKAWDSLLAHQSAEVKHLLAGGIGNLSKDIA